MPGHTPALATVNKPTQAVLLIFQHSTAQHSTAQHSTAQHSTAQHSTAQQGSRNQHTKDTNPSCHVIPTRHAMPVINSAAVEDNSKHQQQQQQQLSVQYLMRPEQGSGKRSGLQAVLDPALDCPLPPALCRDALLRNNTSRHMMWQDTIPITKSSNQDKSWLPRRHDHCPRDAEVHSEFTVCCQHPASHPSCTADQSHTCWAGGNPPEVHRLIARAKSEPAQALQ
jgi:hypothetical protein